MYKNTTKLNKLLFSIFFLNLIFLSNAQHSTMDSSFSSSPPINPMPTNPTTLNATPGNSFLKPITKETYDQNRRLFDSLKELRIYHITQRLLFPDFRKASLFFKDSTIARNIFVNIKSPNSYNIQVQNRGAINMSSLIRVVFEKDSTEKDFTVFQNGYLGKKDEDAHLLYQVLAEGKIDLLIKKFASFDDIYRLLEQKAFSNEIDILYIYMNKKLEKVKYNKKFFLDRFKEDRLEIINEFIELNKTNFRKVEDIKELIRFYNHLPEY